MTNGRLKVGSSFLKIGDLYLRIGANPFTPHYIALSFVGFLDNGSFISADNSFVELATAYDVDVPEIGCISLTQGSPLIEFLGSASGDPQPTDPIVLTVGEALDAGEFLVIGIFSSRGDGSATPPNITDSEGSTYTFQEVHDHSADYSVAVYTASVAGAAAALQITATYTDSPTPDSVVMMALKVRGVSGTPVAATGEGDGTTSTEIVYESGFESFDHTATFSTTPTGGAGLILQTGGAFFNNDIFDESSLEAFIATPGNVVLWIVFSDFPTGGTETTPVITANADCVATLIGGPVDALVPFDGTTTYRAQAYFIYGTGAAPDLTLTDVTDFNDPLCLMGAGAAPEGDSDFGSDVADGSGNSLEVNLSLVTALTSTVMAVGINEFSLNGFTAEPSGPFAEVTGGGALQSGAQANAVTAPTPSWQCDPEPLDNNYGFLIAAAVEVLVI